MCIGSIVLAALLLHPYGDATANRKSTQTQEPEFALVRKAIEQREAAYFHAFKNKDADALANLYDENAMLMPPGHATIRGRSAILTFYRDFTATPETLEDEQFRSLALDVCGNFALDVSAFSGHMQAPGKPKTEFHGKNLVIWRRQLDGSWKYYRDMWDFTF